MASRDSKPTPAGIIPGNGEPPGDFRLQQVREQWEHEWAVMSKEARHQVTLTYMAHHRYQMETESRWTCTCPACLATRKRLFLEYWRAEELEHQAFEQHQKTFEEYEALKGSPTVKQETLTRFIAELTHCGQLRKETTRLLWEACGERPRVLLPEQIEDYDMGSM